MSDYLFMLESHLNPQQNRAVSLLQSVATEANVSLFLTGGAMRDMLGGFQIRDLDFVVEGNSLKLAQTIAKKHHVTILSTDDIRKSTELLFPGGVQAQLAMAHTAKYSRPGSKPKVTPATIQEDLRCRDFSFNAIALSLNRGSRGLLIDPLNGQADLSRRELRAVYATALYDDPVRLLRMCRFRVRMGFDIEERTKLQYENARLAEVEQLISPSDLLVELKQIVDEPAPSEMLKTLEEEKLLPLFSPALSGPKLNLAGLARLEKARRFWSPEVDLRGMSWGPFLFALTEKLTAKERLDLIKATAMTKADVNGWQQLPARAKKTESKLKSASLKRPSQIYEAVLAAPASDILFLLYHSPIRLVQDRIRNYFQKYLQTAMEVTEAEVVAAGAVPGTPKFYKVRDGLVAARLDGRVRKPVAPPAPIVVVPEPVIRRGRRQL